MIRFANVWQRKYSFPETHIQGERIYLRPPESQDYPAWYMTRSRSRHDLEEYEPRWPVGCLEQSFFERRLAYQAQNWVCDRSYSFLIFHDETHELLGGININNILRGCLQHASIGYWLDIEARGHGYMQEALKLILEFAFDDIGLKRVNISSLPYNQRSRKVIEAVGFEKEGYARNYLQINGVWQDHVLYGMTLEYFRQQNTCPDDSA